MRKFSFLLRAGLAFGASGCLAPPPGGLTATAASPSVAAGESSSRPGDLGKPLVVWNGDDVNPKSDTWASCDSKPCVATSIGTDNSGSNGSRGIEFKVETPKGWAGFGWNWTSYYPGGAADVTGRKRLKFMLQVEAASADDAPDLAGLQLALRCAKVKQCNKGVSGIAKYEPNAGDGKWHAVSVPLDDMKPDKGSEWDAASVWELVVSGWAPTPKKFVIRLDDVSFE